MLVTRERFEDPDQPHTCVHHVSQVVYPTGVGASVGMDRARLLPSRVECVLACACAFALAFVLGVALLPITDHHAKQTQQYMLLLGHVNLKLTPPTLTLGLVLGPTLGTTLGPTLGLALGLTLSPILGLALLSLTLGLALTR